MKKNIAAVILSLAIGVIILKFSPKVAAIVGEIILAAVILLLVLRKRPYSDVIEMYIILSISVFAITGMYLLEPNSSQIAVAVLVFQPMIVGAALFSGYFIVGMESLCNLFKTKPKKEIS